MALSCLTGCLIKVLEFFAMKKQDTMATTTAGQSRTQVWVTLWRLHCLSHKVLFAVYALIFDIYVSQKCLPSLTMLSHQSHILMIALLTQQMPQSSEQADFLTALLSGSDSVSGSPLWSPSHSDSGISEDPPSDQMDSPQRPESPPGETQYYGSRPQTKADLEANILNVVSKSRINSLSRGLRPSM